MVLTSFCVLINLFCVCVLLCDLHNKINKINSSFCSDSSRLLRSHGCLTNVSTLSTNRSSTRHSKDYLICSKCGSRHTSSQPASVGELVEDANDKLFDQVLINYGRVATELNALYTDVTNCYQQHAISMLFKFSCYNELI